MKHPRYPAYKPSGVEWLGEVPAHWEVTRLRRIAKVNPARSEIAKLEPTTEVSFVPMEAVVEGGGLVLDRTVTIDESQSGFTYFRDNDVVVAKITPCFENGKLALAAGLTNGIALGTTELHVIRSGSTLFPEFLLSLVASNSFRMLGESEMYGAGGQKRVPADFVLNFGLALPPLDEQRAIAAFLDRETAQIDALIAKLAQLIALLQEKRQALISHAVTKGLDPTVKMQDSGVEWLGAVPEHWEVVPLGRATILQRGHDLPQQDRKDGIIPVISSSGPMGYHNEAKAEGPGVVTGRYGTIGEFHYIEGPYWPLNTSLYVVDFNSNLPKFIFYLMKNLPFDMHSDKSAVPGVNRNDLHRLSVAVPPFTEQVAVADFLDLQASNTAALQAQVHDALAKTVERRAALITAAVTGSIDVRGAAVGVG